MPRVQVSNPVSPEGLQTFVSPGVSTVRAEQPGTLQDNPAERLGQALGVISKELKPLADKESTTDAEAWFNSQPVETITAAMRDNKLLPQDNPVFLATVQNMYGRNSITNTMSHMQSQMASGELQFNTPQELRDYAVKLRNEDLQPYQGNSYIQAGYDKSFNGSIDQMTGMWAANRSKETIANGQSQATQALNTEAQSILNPANTLSAEDSVKRWMGTYELLRSTAVLTNPSQQKDALYDNALTFANGGRADLIDSLLNYQVDNGLNVRSLLGNDKAEALLNHARTVGEQQARAAQKATIQGIQSSAQANIDQQITTNMSNGHGAFIPPTYTTVDSEGNYKLEKTDKLIQMRAEADTQSMELPAKIQYYSNNSVGNDQWSNILATGVDNLYTVGIAGEGKDIGQLSDAGKSAFELFRELRAVNPAYAQKIAKGEKTYEVLQTMDDMVNIGFAKDANEAASQVNGEAKVTPADYANIQQRVAASTDSLTSTWLPWNRNNDTNITALNGQVRRLAQAILVNGRAKDPDDAVKIASDHVSLSALQFNGATYTKDQMPMFPQGDPAEYWMEQYGEKVITPKLAANPETSRIGYKDVFWQPQPSGDYQLIKPNSAMPILDEQGNPVVFSKDSIVDFAQKEYKDGTNTHAIDMSYRMFSKRLENEWLIRNNMTGFSGSIGVAMHPDVASARAKSIPTLEQYKAIRGQVAEYQGKQVPVQTLPLPQLNEWMKKYGFGNK